MKQLYPGSINSAILIKGVIREFASFRKTVFYLFCSAMLLSLATPVFADVTLTSSTVAAADINQGTSNNIVYVVKMDVTTTAVTVNNVQFTLGGTYDATDLGNVLVYFNATAASFSGSTYLGYTSATGFAAPHVFSIPINKAMAAGSSGYFIILANVNNDATDNKTIKINGAANPVVFDFATAPTVTNSQTDVAGTQTIQSADITLTSAVVAASDINQGTSNNIVYASQMSVSTEPVTVNNIQFTLGGTYDATDLGNVLVYFNATAASFSGSTYLGYTSATGFAAPHVFSIPINKAMAAGSSGYFIILANVNNDATDNKTIKINGAANPVVFDFATAPTVTNSQTDVAGTQTIQSADITLTSAVVAASDINQGTSNNIVYASQMSVSTEPVTVNNIQFTLGGTYDATDLGNVLVYFNATAASFSGSTYLGYTSATGFAAPHVFSIPINKAMAAGSSGYFIILANVNNDATDNKTIKINGAANPVVFDFATAPTVTNSQTDVAGTQTIQSADITLTSAVVAASDINQGTSNNIVYASQMSVSTEPVTVNNIQFTLGGTYDATDLGNVLVYFNATAASFSGSTYLGYTSATGFAAPHVFSIPINKAMAAGSSGYFIILANVNNDATDNKTIKINGAANPVVFGFATAPTVTNSQTDVAGIQTIQAADIDINTSPLPTDNFVPGTNNNLVYAAQMSVSTEPVTVNNIQFTLGGTYDANDLGNILIYFNATAASFSGSTYLGYTSATGFAAPHVFSIPINKAMAAGSSGYFIILANIDAAATLNHSVQIDGIANPVVFGFVTDPNITNNQTNIGGVHTLPVHFVSIEADQKDKSIEIKWNVDNELNIEKYMLERSGNGRDFIPIAQTAATGNNANLITYHSLDGAPLRGNNFYRVYAVNLDGTKEYSPVVKINMDKNIKGISIYPNPVLKNGMITMAFQNMAKNKYSVKIYSQQGQCILARSLEHNGGNSTQTISLPKIAAGNYILVVSNASMKFEKQILVE